MRAVGRAPRGDPGPTCCACAPIGAGAQPITAAPEIPRECTSLQGMSKPCWPQPQSHHLWSQPAASCKQPNKGAPRARAAVVKSMCLCPSWNLRPKLHWRRWASGWQLSVQTPGSRAPDPEGGFHSCHGPLSRAAAAPGCSQGAPEPHLVDGGTESEGQKHSPAAFTWPRTLAIPLPHPGASPSPAKSPGGLDESHSTSFS